MDSARSAIQSTLAPMTVRPWLATLLLVPLLLQGHPAQSAPKHKPTRHSAARRQPKPAPTPALAATRFAKLGPAACRQELRRLGTSVKAARGPTNGVAFPVRLSGPLGNIQFQTPHDRSPYSLLDGRLALVLEKLAELLAKNDVVAVRIDNFYRPKARLPHSRKKSQHAYGLAVDITEFTLNDGQVLNVERDWGGRIGAPVCGTGTKANPSAKAALLRRIVCQVYEAGIFHHLLTPNFNRAHKNHFHFDIRRGDSTSTIE